MASTEEDLIEISEGEIKEIVEKYRQTAKHLCDGGSVACWAAIGRLVKVGHLNKDLELEGIQLVTTQSNFLACISAPSNGRNACAHVSIWLNDYINQTPIFKFVEDYQKSQDIVSLKKYRKWTDRCEQYVFSFFKEAQQYYGEIYAWYIITRGPYHDQVIDSLAAARQELRSAEATVSYIHLLLTEVNSQLDQVSVENVNHIPKQLLVKFYIHSTFMDEILAFVRAIRKLDICGTYDNLLHDTPPSFEERYEIFEAKCQSITEAMKILIDDGEKRLQSKLRDGIHVLKGK